MTDETFYLRHSRLNSGNIYLRVGVSDSAICRFSYSPDGKASTEAGEAFRAAPGKWTGDRVGIFCTRETPINDSGWADFGWFRVEKPE